MSVKQELYEIIIHQDSWYRLPKSHSSVVGDIRFAHAQMEGGIK